MQLDRLVSGVRFQAEPRRICYKRFGKKQLNVSLLRESGEENTREMGSVGAPCFCDKASELAFIIADT